MRGICFKEQLFDLIVNGRKTVTRRMADRYKVGETLYLKEPYFVNENGSVDYKFDNKVKHEKDGKTVYSRYSVVIDGKNTMSMYGGDYGSVYEPEVYIRHLARLNGFKYGGIIKE